MSGAMVYGVAADERVLRLVALRRAGTGFALVEVRSLPLSDDDPSTLQAALQELGVPSGARVALALPAAGCTFKTANLPPARAQDLAAVLRFEAEAQFPLPLVELVWDAQLTPALDGGQHAVLVGCRQSLVDAQVTLAQAAGLTLQAVRVAPLAAASALALPNGPVLLVLAGPAWTDLTLFMQGGAQGCRSIRAGTPEAPEWATRVARELHSWLNEHPLGSILLVGDITPGCTSALAQACGRPVQVGDPWQKIQQASGCLAHLPDAPAAYATALGLAQSLLQRGTQVNLLPAPLLAARVQRRRQGLLAGVLTLAILLLAGASWMTHTQVQARQAELATLTRQVQQLQRTSPGPAPVGLKAAQQVTEGLTVPSSDPLEILRRVSVALPEEGFTLNTFTFDRGRTLVLKGHATSQTVLATALQGLSTCGVVDRVMLDTAQLSSIPENPGYDFQMTGTLPPAADPTRATTRGTTTKSTGTTPRS